MKPEAGFGCGCEEEGAEFEGGDACEPPGFAACRLSGSMSFLEKEDAEFLASMSPTARNQSKGLLKGPFLFSAPLYAARLSAGSRGSFKRAKEGSTPRPTDFSGCSGKLCQLIFDSSPLVWKRERHLHREGSMGRDRVAQRVGEAAHRRRRGRRGMLLRHRLKVRRRQHRQQMAGALPPETRQAESAPALHCSSLQ